MKHQKFRMTKYDTLVTIHYEAAIKVAEIEVGEDLTDQETVQKWSELKEQLERTEAELSNLYEDFEIEDFHCALRAILQ